MNRRLILLFFILVLGSAVWLGLSAGNVSSSLLQKTGDDLTQPAKASSKPTKTIEKHEPAEAGIARLSGPERIQQWLTSATDPRTIEKNILEGFTTLDTKDHLLAIISLVPLVDDDHFEGLRRIMLDPRTSAEAKDYLFRDASQRSDATKLPLMLAIMQQKEHPCAVQARDILQTQFSANFGDNFSQWEMRIREEMQQ